jgi:hypothetical protein
MTDRRRICAIFSTTIALASLSACAEIRLLNPPDTSPINASRAVPLAPISFGTVPVDPAPALAGAAPAAAAAAQAPAGQTPTSTITTTSPASIDAGGGSAGGGGTNVVSTNAVITNGEGTGVIGTDGVGAGVSATSGGGTGGSGTGGGLPSQYPLINVVGNLVEPTFVAPPPPPAALTCLTPDTLVAPAQLDYSLRTLFAGNFQTSGYQDGSSSVARFDGPRAFSIDSKGTIYVVDLNNKAIRRISNPGGVVDTLASVAISGGDFTCIAVTSDGTVYAADIYAHTIRKIDRCTGAVTTVAGSGVAGFADGPSALAATFDQPYRLAVDRAGTKLYVGEKGKYDPNSDIYHFEYRIRVIDLVAPGNPVSTLIAGNFHLPQTPSSTDLYTGFNDFVVDSLGTVFVLPGSGGEIMKILPNGIQTTFVGDLTNPIRTATDGTGTAALLSLACANLAIDNSDNMYFRDANSIRKVTPAALVTTLSTTGLPIAGWTVDKFGVLYGSSLNSVVKTSL